MREFVRIQHVLKRYPHVSGRPWEDVLAGERLSARYRGRRMDVMRGTSPGSVLVVDGEVVAGSLDLAIAIDLGGVFVPITLKE